MEPYADAYSTIKEISGESMSQYYHHPLDALYPNNHLVLLEALIPYVDSSLKFPLALLIKFRELSHLSFILNSPVELRRYDLNRNIQNQEEFLHTLGQVLGTDMLNQMKSMESMLQAMSIMQEFSKTSSDLEQSVSAGSHAPSSINPKTTDHESTQTLQDIETMIREILAEHNPP